MRRHSDTLRGARRRRKRGLRGEKRVKRKRLPVVFPSFPERGQTGENARANAVSRRALSLVNIKFPVASADMRRHSDTLRAANAAMKEGFTGRKQNKRSEFCCLPVLICLFVKIRDPSFPGHAPGKDTLRAANAAMKTRFTGRKQNKRSEFCCLPVLICLPVHYLTIIAPPVPRFTPILRWEK